MQDSGESFRKMKNAGFAIIMFTLCSSGQENQEILLMNKKLMVFNVSTT
jgi:hypothetical protein